jgi:peptidoglycan hydrolase-like protein with peptidoglycan-binding domain
VGPVRGDPTIWRAQRELAALGYDPLGDDGIFGSRTRTALNDFQRDFGQPVTSSLTSAAMDRLETEYARIAPPGALGEIPTPLGQIRRF